MAEGRIWLAETADEDIYGFIAHASDAEFKKRFPAWFEAREKFSYDLYKNGMYEQRYQAERQGRKYSLTARDCRRAYKVGMSKVMARSQDEQKNRSPSVQVVRNKQDCLRCILIERGDTYLKSHTIFSCSINVPAGVIITEDRLVIDEAHSLEAGNEDFYPEVLAISTSIGNVESTPAICSNVPPPVLIRNRKVEERSCFQYVNEEHKCNASNVQLDCAAVVELSVDQDSQLYENTPKYMLLYAPSGFGKTTLQMALAEKGIVVADTDDMPGASVERVIEVLKKTSVLTNRLDLISAANIRGIMFTPDSADVLKQHSSHFTGLSDEDFQYFYEAHERVALRNNLTKCRIKNMHLLHWFKCARENIAIHRDLAFEETFIMKASYQSISN